MKKFMIIFFSIIIFISPWVLVNGLPVVKDLSVIENVLVLALALFYAFLKWLGCTGAFILLYLLSFVIIKIIIRGLDFDGLEIFDFLFDKEKAGTASNTACFLGIVLPPFVWWCYNLYQVYLLMK